MSFLYVFCIFLAGCENHYSSLSEKEKNLTTNNASFFEKYPVINSYSPYGDKVNEFKDSNLTINKFIENTSKEGAGYNY